MQKIKLAKPPAVWLRNVYIFVFILNPEIVSKGELIFHLFHEYVKTY